ASASRMSVSDGAASIARRLSRIAASGATGGVDGGGVGISAAGGGGGGTAARTSAMAASIWCCTSACRRSLSASNARLRSSSNVICGVLRIIQPQAAEWFILDRPSREHVGRHTSIYGGDSASTGVRNRGMHAERHRLVNPVEHNVTADTQLALAA